MSKMLDRIKAFQNRATEQGATPAYSGQKEDIFYDFAEGTPNRIRLVGTWITLRSHFIGPSKFNAVKLFKDAAFVGDNPLKKNINCVDFDSETEMPVAAENRECVVCRLHAAANDILFQSGKDLDKDQTDFLNGIAKAAKSRERIFFLCIDRDHPEILPGKKGFKVVEFPKPLFEKFTDLAGQYNDFEFYDENDGVDLLVTKRPKPGQQKGFDYSIAVATAGRGFAFTPLTAEEKAYEKPDIRKIFGKKPDQAALLDALTEDCRELVDIGNAPQGDPAAKDAGADAVPF